MYIDPKPLCHTPVYPTKVCGINPIQKPTPLTFPWPWINRIYPLREDKPGNDVWGRVMTYSGLMPTY
jgi:hypothetical protein